MPLEQENQRDLIIYDNLKEKDLETVLPKSLNTKVMLLREPNKGELGTMIARDKKKDEVTVQFGMEIVKVS